MRGDCKIIGKGIIYKHSTSVNEVPPPRGTG